MKNKPSISCIGAGNVAWHLCHGLSTSFRIHQVYSRTAEAAKQLSQSIQASPIDDIKQLDLEVDYVFVAVPDKVISEVITFVPSDFQGTIMHCSGSTEMSILNRFENFGVCYPLQTFSKAKNVNLKQVPFFVEGNNAKSLDSIKFIANALSNQVQEYSSSQRMKLHMAAVIACNFSNYMFDWAHQLAGSHEVFKHLLPLISETLEKVEQMEPKDAQTGPAKRGDFNTISKHISQLNDSQEKEAYQMISDLIQKRHAKEL